MATLPDPGRGGGAVGLARRSPCVASSAVKCAPHDLCASHLRRYVYALPVSALGTATGAEALLRALLVATWLLEAVPGQRGALAARKLAARAVNKATAPPTARAHGTPSMHSDAQRQTPERLLVHGPASLWGLQHPALQAQPPPRRPRSAAAHCPRRRHLPSPPAVQAPVPRVAWWVTGATALFARCMCEYHARSVQGLARVRPSRSRGRECSRRLCGSWRSTDSPTSCSHQLPDASLVQ